MNFNTRGVYNFITKNTNILVNLVTLFSDVSFLFCRFLKTGVTNKPKSIFFRRELKGQGSLFKTRQNLAVHKTLVWSAYVRKMLQLHFF